MAADLCSRVSSAEKICRRTLTEDENNDLAELKQKMGLLLAALQEAKLLSPAPLKRKKHELRQESSSSEAKLNRGVEDEVVVVEKDADQEFNHEKQQVGRGEDVVGRSPIQFRYRERDVVEDSREEVESRVR